MKILQQLGLNKIVNKSFMWCWSSSTECNDIVVFKLPHTIYEKIVDWVVMVVEDNIVLIDDYYIILWAMLIKLIHCNNTYAEVN